MEGKLDKRKAEFFVSLLLMFFSIFILVSDELVEGGVETDLGSMFLPRFVAVIIIIFSLSIGVNSLKEMKKEKEKEINSNNYISLKGYSGIFLYLLSVFAYWLIMPYMGFMISTILVMIFIAFLLGGKKWHKIIIIFSFIAISINYGTKEFLHVYLPAWNLF